MSLLNDMGYSVQSHYSALGEDALILSDIILTSVENDLNNQIIDAAYSEGFDPFGEGLFDGSVSTAIRSGAQNVKNMAADGWRMLKELFKKAIQMIKNILKEFFNQEKQVGKLIQDINNALKDRQRNIRDENKIMDVITYESLAEAKVPIHACLADSYTEGVMAVMNLLDGIDTANRSGAASESSYLWDEWKEENLPFYGKGEASNNNNGGNYSKDGKNVNGNFNNNIIKNLMDYIKRRVQSFMSKFKGNNNQIKLNQKLMEDWLNKEIKGEDSLTNAEWRSMLDTIAKIVNSSARNYMDIQPNVLQEFIKFRSSYGLYGDSMIGTEKQANQQKNELNLVQFDKRKVAANDVFELTTNMLNDFLQLYRAIQKRKLSKYFDIKGKNLDMLMRKLDSLANRMQSAQSSTNTNNSNFNDRNTATINQGATDNNGGKAESEEMKELLADINNFGFGEGLFDSSGNPNNSNDNSGNNNQNNANQTAQKSDNPDDTANMLPYIKGYIVGYSQGTMQAATFYNAVLKKWNEACRRTLVAYYAVTSRGGQDEKRADFDVNTNPNGNNNGNSNNQNNNEEIPTGNMGN